MFFLIDWARRRLAAREPFPAGWRTILRRRVPFYRRLREDERERFETKLKIFARTKSFEGVKGLVIDDEVRVVISAAAARLVMNLEGEHYQRLVDIVVYPAHFKHQEEEGAVVLGQAYGPGTVVLSWEAVLRGLADTSDGLDTATHEFAHALDAGDGAFDGTPELATFDAYAPWTRVMSSAFTQLQRKAARGRDDILREYGAKNEAEFFAVATEVFFERPKQMRVKHPELYEILKSYYRADPASH